MMLNNIKIKTNRIVAVYSNEKKDLFKFYDDNDKLVSQIFYNILKQKKIIKEQQEKKINELLKMVSLHEDILNRKFSSLSISEKIKVYFSKNLLENSNIIVIEDFFKFLDYSNKNKMIKILLKLKKYYNKTIFIYTNDLNNIYELIDDIIFIKDDRTYYDDKINIFQNNINIEPEIISFTKKLKEKYPKIEYKDSINELIKELYRELR